MAIEIRAQLDPRSEKTIELLRRKAGELNATLRLDFAPGKNMPQFEGALGRYRPKETQMLIAAKQADWGRNPFFLTQHEKARVTRELREGVTEALAQPTAVRARGAFREALSNVANTIGDAFEKHFDREQSAGGRRFRPLTRRYAEWKQRKFGFVHPILQATKRLYRGMQIKVEMQPGARGGLGAKE